jgi:hypothetical protein
MRRSHLTLAALILAAIALWDWPLLYPIRVFVVLLHELGHGLAAALTGGQIVSISINADLSGVCWSRGGLRLLVLPAGYLGSMAFGGVILVVAARSRSDRWLAAVIGVATLLLSLIFVRSLFGLAFGLGFGLALLAVALWLPAAVNDLLLKFLGLTSVLYAVIDIKEDLISRTVPGSDAYAMSRELFLPPVFWGVLWIAIALAAGVFFLWAAARSESAPPAARYSKPSS